MSVALCIATRGRSQLLSHTVELTLERSTRRDTRIIIDIDDDDKGTLDDARIKDKRVIYSVGPRPATVGAKYNRAFDHAKKATIFVPFVDAVGITTQGWDDRLVEAADQFGDGIGAVYFGDRRDPLWLPRMQALTRKFVEIQGFFIPEFCPWAWWTDTWINEVSWLSRRVIYADVQLEPTPPTKKTRGARDIKFWGDAYYALRQERYEIAARIVAASDYPAWQRAMIMQEIPYWGEILNNREAQTTRDGAWAAQYEQQIGFDAPADTRYNKAKALMVERLAARQQQAAE